MPTTFSPIALRPVLAQAPTPITAVAGLVDAQPTSMIVASFIGLSLDPPLVAAPARGWFHRDFCASCGACWHYPSARRPG